MGAPVSCRVYGPIGWKELRATRGKVVRGYKVKNMSIHKTKCSSFLENIFTIKQAEG